MVFSIAGFMLIFQALSNASHQTSDKIQVVASTNVWGDITQQVGGDKVQVTSILSDPAADPHLFEADAATASKIADAQLIVSNGLGYDEFMDKLVNAAGSSAANQLVVADVLKTDKDANPHLWYDLPRMPEVAAAIANELTEIDPANSDYYQQNAKRFAEEMQPSLALLDKIKREHAGENVAYTERVAGYLIEDADLVDKTPKDFAAAVESGIEPSPQQVQAFEDLLKLGIVQVVFYNNQAVNDVTEQIQAAARAAQISIIGVSETIPPGKNFQTWQLDQLNALLEALGN